MRVAVVHDWLYTFGGAERVLAAILRCLPGADVFTLFDILPEEDRKRIGFDAARCSFLQRMPAIARRHRLYLPLMPLAIEQFDLSGYDLIVSSSYAVAKGVITGPNQLHLAYVHSPMRYAWDLQHQYLRESNLTRGVKSALARLLLHKMRIWDMRTSHGVDAYMVNSHFVGRRVRKIYGKDAQVIYPPVDVPAMPPANRVAENYFLTASRLVPYKKVRAIVEAFAALPDQQLIVVGTGPELPRLQAAAGPNVKFAGFVPDAELGRMMGAAQAFIFAAEEDFGITPLEAQGHGTPVIALGRGGALETIVTQGMSPTGIFFQDPAPEAIAAAVRTFLERPGAFSPAACHANAMRFAPARFEREFRGFVQDRWSAFQGQLRHGQPQGAPDMEAALMAAE